MKVTRVACLLLLGWPDLGGTLVGASPSSDLSVRTIQLFRIPAKGGDAFMHHYYMININLSGFSNVRY
jgi:hypothetical protein